jgi:hypothetical protein
MAKEDTTTLRKRGEKKEDETKEKDDVKDESKPSGDAPKKRTRKADIPGVGYLLAHGNPETAHLPKTWKEIVGYPVALALVFAISLLIFHHAPHDKSTHKGFKQFQMNRPSSLQQEPIQVVDEPKPTEPEEKEL